MLRIGSLGLAAAALLASAASAEDKASAADRAAARGHARQGLKLYELGKYAEAVDELELAYERKPVPALLFNIAQCHRQLGHAEEAARLYRAFLRSDPPARQAAQARELLALVEPALSHKGHASSAPPDAPAADLSPATAAVSDANAAAVPDRAPAVSAPEAVPAAAIAPALPIPDEPRSPGSWPWMTAGGVAAAAFAGGAIESLASRSATSRLAQLHRGTLTVDASTDLSLRNDAASKYSRARALYVVAAVAAAAGVGLYVAF